MAKPKPPENEADPHQFIDPHLVLAIADGGPPLDPSAAVFFTVVEELLELLLRECLPHRRKRVSDYAIDLIKRYLRAAGAESPRQTRREQDRAIELERTLGSAGRGVGDLRKKRARKVEGIELLRQYEALLPKVHALPDRCDQRKHAAALKSSFPELTPQRLRGATGEPPAVVARIVLGQRYEGLAPAVIKRWVREARQNRKALFRVLAPLQALVESRGTSSSKMR